VLSRHTLFSFLISFLLHLGVFFFFLWWQREKAVLQVTPIVSAGRVGSYSQTPLEVTFRTTPKKFFKPSEPQEVQNNSAIPRKKEKTPEVHPRSPQKEIQKESPIMSQEEPSDTYRKALPSSSRNRADSQKDAPVLGGKSSLTLPSRIHLLRGPTPPYPEEEKIAGHQGKVKLIIKVRADGSVVSTTILDSSGYRVLDEIACKTVEKKWLFQSLPVRAGETYPRGFEVIETFHFTPKE
jgi:TonB family protein